MTDDEESPLRFVGGRIGVDPAGIDPSCPSSLSFLRYLAGQRQTDRRDRTRGKTCRLGGPRFFGTYSNVPASQLCLQPRDLVYSHARFRCAQWVQTSLGGSSLFVCPGGGRSHLTLEHVNRHVHLCLFATPTHLRERHAIQKISS